MPVYMQHINTLRRDMAERRDEREHRTHRPKGLRLRCRLRIRSNRKICDQAGEHEQKADAEDRDDAVVERLERTREGNSGLSPSAQRASASLSSCRARAHTRRARVTTVVALSHVRLSATLSSLTSLSFSDASI